jgi:hypothetical protein
LDEPWIIVALNDVSGNAPSPHQRIGPNLPRMGMNRLGPDGPLVALARRYGKRADLIVHEADPINAETGPDALLEALTATDAARGAAAT